MNNKKFNILINEIKNLDTRQFRLLGEEVNSRVKMKKIANILETPKNEICCAHCKSSEIIRWGKRNDLQRYKCKNCNKTFNSLSKTPLARLRRKGHWLEYANCLKNGLTVRKAAVYCGIHRNTSFRWRHRFVNNLKFIKAKELSGIIESGEVKFKESFKGSKLLNSALKNKRKDVFVLYNIDRNRNVVDITNKGFNKSLIENIVRNHVAKKSLIISEDDEIYRNIKLNSELKHFIIKSNFNTNDYITVKNIKDFREKFKEWVNNHFRGVATKYLENYVSWYRSLKEFRSGINSLTLLYRAKQVEKYRHQPQKVTAHVL